MRRKNPTTEHSNNYFLFFAVIFIATKVAPVFRIFDCAKAIEFYVEWLGFTIDWEHRFDDNSSLYMQVLKSCITLHLTEHHGDCCPGSRLIELLVVGHK